MGRYFLFCVIAGISINATVACAAGGDFDLGIIIGDPTGVSAKKWLDATHAIDVAVGWKTGSVDETTAQADYLIHDLTIFGNSKWPSVLYYGIGIRVNDRSNRRQRDGLRLPVGVELQPTVPSLLLFAEIAPRLDVTPKTDLQLDAAIGFRYRFGATNRQ